MRGLIAVILLVAGLGVAVLRAGAEPALPAVPDEEAMAPVHALFDAMRAGDTVALAATFHPDARLNSTAVRDGRPVVSASSVDDFVRAIGGSEAYLDERLGEATLLVDGGLATAWTPYAFFVDGEFSHCGVNAFQLVLTEEGWKILQVTDTRRRETCPPGAPR